MSKKKHKVPPVFCPYCREATKLVNAREIYGPNPQFPQKRYWFCQPCEAWVACHNGPRNLPMGHPANRELRVARQIAHMYFDTIWMARREAHPGVRNPRQLAYSWLADQLGLPKQNAHIGHFDVKGCQRVIDICRPLALEEDKTLARREQLMLDRLKTGKVEANAELAA